MQWNSYRSVSHEGVNYGMKADSFMPYISLPAATNCRFQLAVQGSQTPFDLLRASGWELVDAPAISRDPWTYEAFIRASRAEFSVAKQGYVVSRSGWFSERSCHYLAMGKPVVVQDTGFTSWLSAQKGVLPFSTPAEAMEQLDCLAADYPGHCRSAREVAEIYFDSRTVLQDLLDRVASTPDYQG